MQCSRCGAPVQPGMAFCPNCGTPYASAQNAPIPPTQYAGPSSYDQGQQVYNAGQAYAPQAPASNETPGGYGTPPPAPNAYNAQSPYGTPPPPPNLYGAPYAPPSDAFMSQAQQPRKKGPRVGLIIGIAVLLLVLIGGGVLALKGLNHSGDQTPGPSGSPVDSGAASVITNLQTASGIDANLLPTNVTNQFKVGDVVYVTYNLHLTQSGYVQARVYLNGVYGTQTSLAVTVGKYDHGYFDYSYKQAGTGAFELYWCLQSNCSDAKLAAFATFTVA